MKLPEELQFIQNGMMPQKSTDARLDGKICVISGTTSGIGLEAAKQLAQGGAHLVMICRNEEKAISVQKLLSEEFGGTSDIFIADFQKLSEVQHAALLIKENYPKIHVLINNVGIFSKRRRFTPDGNEITLGIVHLASFLLTRLLIENLKKGAPSRVIYINSEAHRFGGLSVNDLNWHKRPYIGMLAYGAAKIAQIHTAMVLADQLEDYGVMVNLMHPGAVRTNIGMDNGLLYRLYNRYILNLFLKDPYQSGKAIYYLSADPSLDEVTGKYFNLTIEEKPAWYSVRPEKRQTVWKQSEALIAPYLEVGQ